MNLRRMGVLAAAVLVAMVGQTTGATAATTGADTRAEQLIQAKTGQIGQVLPAAGVDMGGHRVKPAKGLTTWLQREGGTVRLVAKLSKGQSTGVFEDLVPAGWTMARAVDGTYEVFDAEGRVAGRILSPWAVDASGNALPTHFEVHAQSLRQVVDTKGATFPVVMDPTITTGWWYVTPVSYMKFNWSETWKLKNYIDDNRTLIVGLLCNWVPTIVARTTCQALFITIRTDVIITVNSAIANRKCYKVRLPASGGIQALPAYDSYYVTC